MLTQVQHECPKVLAGDGYGGEFRGDLLELLAAARESSVRPAYIGFAHEVAQLSWSSRELTRDVAREAKAVLADLSVPQPDLCAEARAYVSSKYKTVPAGVSRFSAERFAIESELPPPRRFNALLLHYEREAGLTTPPTIRRPTAQERADERALFNEYETLVEDLGLSPT